MGREACEGQVDSRTGLKNAALYLHVLSVLHGGELRVDIPGVSVGELAYGEGVTAYAKISGRASKRAPIFFCNISELRLRKILREGDGGPIPTQTLIKGLFVAGPSRFKLLNVKLFSNGSVNVIVDEDSAVASAPM